MNQSSAPKSPWLTKNAVIVSDLESVNRMYSQLTAKFNWRVTECTQSLEQAIGMIRAGKVSLLIIDDSIASPSIYHCRRLFADILTLATPVLVFLLPQRSHESALLSKMGFHVVLKPVTPAAFHQRFTELLQCWEKPEFTALRRLGYLLSRITDEQLIGALSKLMNSPSIQHLCAQMLALHYRNAGKLREAEQSLLSSIKRDPRQDGRLIMLLDTYLSAAMPKMAEQILNSIRNVHGLSLFLAPDWVQAHLMMGQLSTAADILETIVKGETPDPLVIEFYARLLFAAGRDNEAEPLLQRSGRSFKKFQAQWHSAESSGLPAAS